MKDGVIDKGISNDTLQERGILVFLRYFNFIWRKDRERIVHFGMTSDWLELFQLPLTLAAF
jgi:hypothetical protein